VTLIRLMFYKIVLTFIKDWYRESYTGDVYEKKFPQIKKLTDEIDSELEKK